jgi:tetratricopeptide (TPR) repeat protein
MADEADTPRDPDPDISDGIWDDGIRAAFSPPSEPGEQADESILEAISRISGSQPRVLLRDDPDDHSPVLKALPRNGPEAVENDRRYQVLGEIARGGVGIVYKSRDRDLGRNVAIKVLRPDHADNPDVIDRFVEEAQVEGQLQHPNIVPVYGLGMQPDGRPYFVMKLVKGQTLSARLQGREDAGEDRHSYLTVFEQVCRAMAYAHARGVIHRDLKPANVMIGAFGEVQVMDWGFAKVMGRDEKPVEPAPATTIIATVRSAEDGSQSIAGSVMGTPAYMPPEQALGRIAELDERSDVFSLGAILCEILTGHPPYVGEPADLLVMAAQCRQEETHERLDSCGAAEALVAIVKRCLSPMRAERPENAGAVGEEIHRHLAEVEERARRAEVAAAEEHARQEEENARLAKMKLDVEKLKARAAEEHAEAERERRSEAKAQRRAESERRARWGVVGLAAVLLLAAVLGGFGWLRHGQEERARMREISGKVTAALQQATDHEGREEWGRALETAQTARDLAEKADESTRARAAAVHARIEQGNVEAEAQKERSARDDAFLARLEDLAIRRASSYFTGPSGGGDGEHGGGGSNRTDYETHDADLSEAFQEYGIDLDVLDPEEAAFRIRASSRPVGIAARLVSWAWNLDHSWSILGRNGRRLFAIAKLADPDPVRGRYRDAMFDGDAAKLAELAEGVSRSSLSASTLNMLASALWVHRRDRADEIRSIEMTRLSQLRSPESIWVRFQLCERLYEIGETEESIRWAETICSMRPDSDYAVGLLAKALAWRGDFDEAEKLCRDALSGGAQAYYGLHATLGWISHRRGNFDLAVQQYEEALARGPSGWAHPHWIIGRILWDRGERQKALERLMQACEADENHHQSLHYLAWCSGELKDHANAVALWKRACQTSPACMRSWWGWIETLQSLERTDEIAEVAEEARRLAPGDSRLRMILASVLQARGDEAGAMQAYRDAIAHDPDQPEPHLQLARVLCDDSPEVAIVHARKAVRLAPDPVAWNALSCVYVELGEIEKALDAQREGIRLVPTRAGLGNLVSLYLALDRVAEAKGALDQLLSLGSDHPSALWALSKYHMHGDETEEAMRIVEQAVESVTDLPWPYYNRGALHARMGSFDKAVEDLERALEIHRRVRRIDFRLTAYNQWEYQRVLGEFRAMTAVARRKKTIQAGSETASSATEALIFAKLCHWTYRDAAAVCYFREAFTGSPALADDLDSLNLLDGALSAIREAGTAVTPVANDLREQACAWARAWLVLARRRLESGDLQDRRRASRTCTWTLKGHGYFTAVRGDRINELPEAEREAWRTFWRDVEEFLKLAAESGE